jgi:NAD(P)-dependent dehydrogenase (short-subunit alcohol dehydrogenase family)
MLKELKDKVVVITGASSGIGRATALEFATEGAKLVLAGRDNEALKETKQECETSGAEALPVNCDVTQEDQVERLAARAEETYGHIDIWVNNAGVSLYAKFDEAPSEDYRQVIETDFFGYVYGARAAIKRFKAQGHGSLINVDSIEGITPKPYNSAYTAAKHAVRALASSIRMELALDGHKNIHVSTVMPASVDTPLFAHAANYTGQSLQAPQSATAPAEVAKAITKLAVKPQRELLIGMPAKRSAFKYMFQPASYERGTAQGFPARHLGEEPVSHGQGNLFDPTSPHTIHGGAPTREPNRRPLIAAAPWIAAAGVIVGLGSLATWLLWPGTNRTRKLTRLVPRKS